MLEVLSERQPDKSYSFVVRSSEWQQTSVWGLWRWTLFWALRRFAYGTEHQALLVYSTDDGVDETEQQQALELAQALQAWALTWAMKKLPTHCPFVGVCGISTSRGTGLVADESPEKKASSEVFPVLGVGRDVSAMTLPALAAGALFVADVRSGAPNDDAARPGVVKAENEAGSIGVPERRLSVLGCCEPVTLVPAHCGPLRTNVGSYVMGAPFSRLAPVLPSFLMNNSLGSESIPLPRLRSA